MIGKFVVVAVAGGVGSVCRYWLQGLVQSMSRGLFPVGTLAVNVAGCLFIGLLGAYFAGPQLIREEIRIALTIGLLGGFTTFSSFAWETISLVNDGQFARALANVLVSNGLGLSAAWIGYRLGERAFGV